MISYLDLAGPGGGAEEHAGPLPAVGGLPGAAGRQTVLTEQLRRQEPDQLDCGGDPSFHLAPRPAPPDQVPPQPAHPEVCVKHGDVCVT